MDKVTVKGSRMGELGAFLTTNEEPLGTNGGIIYCFVCVIPE